MKPKSYITRTGFEIKYIGPDLSIGPLPSVFYFALSSKDSLCLDPFNQPAHFLVSDKIRVFSVSIPGHENDLPKEKAIEFWANKVRVGHCPLSHFFDEVTEALNELKDLFLENSLGFCGLSRGGFVALHLAYKIDFVRHILAFAPLLKLEYAKEFEGLETHPIVKKLDTFQLIDDLLDKNIRIYIGNRDTRVGTQHSFDFITKLADSAYEKRIRQFNYELTLSTSIGYAGHGTSPETFKSGCDWLREKLYDEQK